MRVLGLRQQRSGRKVERLRDRAQHAHRRVAGAAFDLRQVALGGLRTLAPIAAASCRAWRDCAAPRGRWPARNAATDAAAALRGRSIFSCSLALGCRLSHALALMHYNSCSIMHTRLRIWQAAAYREPPALTRKSCASRRSAARPAARFPRRLRGRDRRARGPAGSPAPAFGCGRLPRRRAGRGGASADAGGVAALSRLRGAFGAGCVGASSSIGGRAARRLGLDHRARSTMPVSGTRHSKASSRPVTGDTGSQRSDT